MWSEELFCSLCCLSPLHVGTAVSQNEFCFACSTLLLLLTEGTYKNPSGIILASHESYCAHPSCRFSAPPSHLWGRWRGSMVEAVDSWSLLLLTLVLNEINLACSAVRSCVTEVYINSSVLKCECCSVKNWTQEHTRFASYCYKHNWACPDVFTLCLWDFGNSGWLDSEIISQRA